MSSIPGPELPHAIGVAKKPKNKQKKTMLVKEHKIEAKHGLNGGGIQVVEEAALVPGKAVLRPSSAAAGGGIS